MDAFTDKEFKDRDRLRVLMTMFRCAKVYKTVKECVEFYIEAKEPETAEKNVKYKIKKTLEKAEDDKGEKVFISYVKDGEAVYHLAKSAEAQKIFKHRPLSIGWLVNRGLGEKNVINRYITRMV